MARSAPVPLPSDLATFDKQYVTVRQLADHTGISGRTIRFWCQEGAIAGVSRRSERKESDWLIPIAAARRIEADCGLLVKHHAA